MTSISDYYYYYIKVIHKICILHVCYLLFTNHQIESVLFILPNIMGNKSFYVSPRSYFFGIFYFDINSISEANYTNQNRKLVISSYIK